MMKFHKKLFNHLINIPGWRTNRKIVVIESDDWGSIRMPSKDAYAKFLNAGIRVDNDPYCRYDALESADDLTALFETLNSVKDKNGNPAILTANTIMTNPDFQKIEESDFTEYHFEHFAETLKRYYPNENVESVLFQGISDKVFKPQFHGREHLNVKKWMLALQNNEKATRFAFNLNTFGLTNATSSSVVTNYMGAFDSCLPEDIEYYKSSIIQGLDLFQKYFGYRSLSFIAPTYTWSSQIESTLKENGIDYLQGLVSQRIPLNGGGRFSYKKGNFQGAKSKNGQFYLMRNCYFEPTHFRDKYDVVDDCLNRIKIAFKWHKAAVIGTHRLNFVGSIDELNRVNNQKLFSQLLCEIVKRWPDVEFMSSDQLGNLVKYKEQNDSK